ncbi:2-oxo acid dehydrogenase subunit E2, partial [Amycolatopsis lurida]
MSSSSPASQFGPNEWVVEEMYDQFLADPSSVDAAWHDFFADFKPTQDAQAKADDARQTTAEGSPDMNGQAATPTPQTVRNAESAAKQTAPAKAAPKTAPKTEAKAAAPKAAPKAPSAQAPAEKDAEPESKQLRGAAAAIAKNMDASLSVPTATSVRAVPAKLMADNRIVINNHLKRTRGGKISFTHLIGYAMVRALKNFPNMNRHYQLIDGKPFAVTPEHVNFGLAIDMKGKEGSRTLV